MASPYQGTGVYAGTRKTVITSLGTTQVVTGTARVFKLLVYSAGTGWTVDIYDDTGAGTANRIWSYSSVDGKVALNLDVPMTTGIKVVSGGTTAGALVLVYS